MGKKTWGKVQEKPDTSFQVFFISQWSCKGTGLITSVMRDRKCNVLPTSEAVPLSSGVQCLFWAFITIGMSD